MKRQGLKLNKDKCKFNMDRVSFLDHEISSKGVHIDAEKVEAVDKMQAPRNIKELRKVLGMINFLTKFVPSAQEVLSPMNQLLKSDTEWSWGADQ